MNDSWLALTDAPAGKMFRVCAIEGGSGVQGRLLALGIRAGVNVMKISDSFARGPIVIRHGQTQTALGRGICQKILVEGVG